MTENSAKQSLIIDFSGFLNIKRIDNLVSVKKNRYKLPGTISGYLKKVEYERVFDFATFGKIFKYCIKAKDSNYDLIWLENFPEVFLLYEDHKKLKSLANKLLKKLAKFAFRANVLIVGALISHLSARAI